MTFSLLNGVEPLGGALAEGWRRFFSIRRYIAIQNITIFKDKTLWSPAKEVGDDEQE